MMDVELSPTLVARLGVLESHVLDPEVSEILVAGPGQIYVTRRGGGPAHLDIDFDDAAVRSLASRLSRALTRREQTRAGEIAPGLHCSVVGTPRGQRPPVIRFVRRAPPAFTLSQLAEAGVLDRDAELRLLDACRTRRSIVISGHPGSGRTDLLAALSRVWKEERRVAVLDGGEGRLGRAAVGHVTLEPDVGAEGAAMTGAEVIVADEPRPSLWADLLSFGRPFLATLEAADAQGALDRMVALCLFERSDASQMAGMAMVESSVHLVVEMERTGSYSTIRSIAEPWRTNGSLTARRLMRPDVDDERIEVRMPSGGAPMTRPPDVPSQPGPTSELRSVVAIPREITRSQSVEGSEFEFSDLSEIRPEQLMSASFVGRLKDAQREVEQTEETPDLPLGSTEPESLEAPEPAPPKPVAAPREASERTPTVIGFDDADSPEVDFEDETRAPDEMTVHAEAGEMVDGELPLFHAAEEKRPSETARAVPDDEESWDDEAPSELIPQPPVGDAEPDETDLGPFGNERTPSASMLDQEEELTNDEIEEMLEGLDEVVDSLEEANPKQKRRNRRAR